MLEKAIEKLQVEMDQVRDNAYVQVVGGYLIKFIKKNPPSAEMFLAEEKTIAKSLEEMKKEASKKKQNNFAMFTLEEGLEIVLKYFGINTKPEVEVPEPTIGYIENINSKVASVHAESKADKKVDFDIKLEDFLS